jgi:hypothetical protein
MRHACTILLVSSLVLAAACGGQSSNATGTAGGTPTGSTTTAGTGGSPTDDLPPPTLRSDVTPVTSTDQAKPGVFIPPFLDCRDPLPGEVGQGPDGKVCTHVAISGCTEPGKNFADYASCDVVKTQRPFWQTPPAKQPDPNDPRLQDANFMGELAWVTQQIEACGCVCCHDSSRNGGKAGEWDIHLGPIWTDTLSDSGLALFTGLADSSALGAYPASDNHGFDRSVTGVPSDDTTRMQKFFLAELARRGITEEQAKQVPPFGGPVYALLHSTPQPCNESQGIDPDGTVNWTGGAARYVYVLEADAANPGVPPNLDLPEGTLWRLDVLASADAVASGLRYGTTPPGSFQAYPETSTAPKLVHGKTYHLVALWDMGLAPTNCLFTYQGN